MDDVQMFKLTLFTIPTITPAVSVVQMFSHLRQLDYSTRLNIFGLSTLLD